ncbi:MAG: VTT domain-containing protein [Dehalococcoidia bacterium]
MDGDNPSVDVPGSKGPAATQAGEQRGKAGKGRFLSRKLFLRVLILLVVVGITSCVFIYRGQITDLQGYGYLGAFLISLIAAATVILPVPGIVLIAALGSAYNPVLVGLAAGGGAALGEITGYMAGYSGQVVVENSRVYQRLEQWMKRRGLIVIFFFSLVPNPFFDLAGAVAGILKFPLWRFLVICFLGKTLMNIGVASLGGWGFTWVTEHF